MKKEHHRKQLFIKKLRLEFATIELVERKTGLPFSRGDVPRYLDELRSDLKTMVAEAENGEIIEGALKSIARDAYFIEHISMTISINCLSKRVNLSRESPFLQSCQPRESERHIWCRN